MSNDIAIFAKNVFGTYEGNLTANPTKQQQQRARKIAWEYAASWSKYFGYDLCEVKRLASVLMAALDAEPKTWNGNR